MGSRCIAEVADATIYLPVSKPMVDHHVVQLSMDWVKGKTIFFPKKNNPLKLRSMISSELWKFHSIGISGCVDVKVRGDLLYTKKRAFTTGCQSKWDVTCTEKIE